MAYKDQCSVPLFAAFLRAASALLLTAMAGSAADTARFNIPAFQTTAQMVLVPVTVTDHFGRTVAGLRAQDFTVFDDQTPQPIASFTSEDAPCSVGLVLDISGSMRDALATARNVAHAFFQTANPDDEFLMLTVSTKPEAASEFTADTDFLEQAIQAERPGGMTALIDTVYAALRDMRQGRHSRRTLLVLSDGMDNFSRYSRSDLMRAALEADIQVYAILMDGLAEAPAGALFRPNMVAKPGDRVAERDGPRVLEELAEKTGGLHLRVRSARDAQEAAVKIGSAMRNEYVIGYRSPDAGTSGKWHEVRVKSSVRKVNVYGRNGYYSR